MKTQIKIENGSKKQNGNTRLVLWKLARPQ